MNKLSLRMRILVPIIVLIIIGMAATTIFSSSSTVKIVDKIITEQLHDTTEGVSVQIDRWVETLQRDITTLSERAPLPTSFSIQALAVSSMSTKLEQP